LQVVSGDSKQLGRTFVISARRGSRDVLSGDSPDLGILIPRGQAADSLLLAAEPRREFDDIVIEGCPARFRIAVPAGTQINRIEELITNDSTAIVSSLTSLEGSVSGVDGSSRNVTVERHAATTIVEGDTLRLRWNAPANKPLEGKSRSYFLRAQSATVSSALARTAMGLMGTSGPRFVFALHAARPNPFSSETTIEYSLAKAADASLRLYDVSGRLIRTLVHGLQPAGPSAVVWDGRDERGVRIGSGVYFARLESTGQHSNRKMIFVGH
jgi:hypothetical protein